MFAHRREETVAGNSRAARASNSADRGAAERGRAAEQKVWETPELCEIVASYLSVSLRGDAARREALQECVPSFVENAMRYFEGVQADVFAIASLRRSALLETIGGVSKIRLKEGKPSLISNLRSFLKYSLQDIPRPQIVAGVDNWLERRDASFLLEHLSEWIAKQSRQDPERRQAWLKALPELLGSWETHGPGRRLNEVARVLARNRPMDEAGRERLINGLLACFPNTGEEIADAVDSWHEEGLISYVFDGLQLAAYFGQYARIPISDLGIAIRRVPKFARQIPRTERRGKFKSRVINKDARTEREDDSDSDAKPSKKAGQLRKRVKTRNVAHIEARHAFAVHGEMLHRLADDANKAQVHETLRMIHRSRFLLAYGSDIAASDLERLLLDPLIAPYSKTICQVASATELGYFQWNRSFPYDWVHKTRHSPDVVERLFNERAEINLLGQWMEGQYLAPLVWVSRYWSTTKLFDDLLFNATISDARVETFLDHLDPISSLMMVSADRSASAKALYYLLQWYDDEVVRRSLETMVENRAHGSLGALHNPDLLREILTEVTRRTRPGAPSTIVEQWNERFSHYRASALE